MRTIAIFVIVVLVCLGVWVSTYPSTSDPKNIKYVLWKSDLYPLDVDVATGTMIGDGGRNTLVIGKTEAQLRRKFGYLLTASEASLYLRTCYQNSSWNGKRVLFIRKSPWMVVFDGTTATDLVLIKGC